MKKSPDGLKLPEFGSEKDFQLQQALNKLKGLPVTASKTQTVRPPESKDKDEDDKSADNKDKPAGKAPAAKPPASR